MRIWDIEPKFLCKNHLLGEHRELHAIWNVITNNKKGYSNHPETKRWVGKLKALYIRHERLVIEMDKRKYVHKSLLNKSLANDSDEQNIYVDSIKEQIINIKNKKCFCKMEMMLACYNRSLPL